MSTNRLLVVVVHWYDAAASFGASKNVNESATTCVGGNSDAADPYVGSDINVKGSSSCGSVSCGSADNSAHPSGVHNVNESTYYYL